MYRVPLPILVAAVLALLPTAAAAQSSTVSGVSRALNPAISVNGLFWGLASRDDDSPENNGVYLQEAEFRFTSIVDPYWKADLTLAVHPAHAHEGEGEEEEAEGSHQSYELDVEEAYIDGRQLPFGFGLRLGKFYLPFGKQMPLHTHQWAFARQPLAVRAFMGDHGLSEVGAQLAYALPLPWYSDLKVYGVNGTTEPPFDAASLTLTSGARWDNLWDLGSDSTVGLGGSFLRGPSLSEIGEHGQYKQWGADVTYKWISSSRSKGPALNLTAEAILPRPDQEPGKPAGWFAIAQFRFHRNWWISGSYGLVDEDAQAEEHHEEEEEEEHHEHGFGEMVEYKLQLAYVPSEFSTIRAEVNYFQDRANDRDELMFIMQVNFTIGSHPAHLY